jgi:transposase
MPKKAGERVTTNRRAAIKLARVMRAGDLTPVEVPTGEDDALRDRGRAREEAIGARKAAQLRLTAFVRRHDLRSTGRATWGPAHLRWRSAGVWPTPAQQLVFQEYVRAVNEHTERLERRAHERTAQGQTWRLAPVVDALQALRGVPCTVTVTTVAERGDLTRCTNPRQVMPSLGFTPAASAPGERRRQGGSTKTGHTQARRALIEGAWADRSPAHVSRPLQLRREKGPKPVQDSSGKAQVRRCTRERQLSARGNPPTQGVVAVARALRALLGAMAQAVPLLASTPTVGSLDAGLLRFSPSLGRDAAPVRCRPRRREEAARNPRPENEAGT